MIHGSAAVIAAIGVVRFSNSARRWDAAGVLAGVLAVALEILAGVRGGIAAGAAADGAGILRAGGDGAAWPAGKTLAGGVRTRTRVYVSSVSGRLGAL